MSGFVKKAVVWLGLNEEFPTDDRAIVESPRPERPAYASPPRGTVRATDRPASSGAGSNRGYSDQQESGASPQYRGGGYADSSVRVIPMDLEPGDVKTSSSAVRPIAAAMTTKPQLIIPKSFNDAQKVADAFRDLKPVIVNMQNAERDLARRLIDFSSGLCYGLGGSMERVAEQVYLLTPDEVQVSDEERQRFLG